MKNKKIKLITVFLLVMLVFVMVPSVAFAQTFGVSSSAVSSLVSSQAGDICQKALPQLGSGSVLQPEKTEVRVEDTTNDTTPTIMQGWDKVRMRKGDRVYMGKWNDNPISWSVINPKGANITYVQGTSTKEPLALSYYSNPDDTKSEDDAVFLMTTDPLPGESISFCSRPWPFIDSKYTESGVKIFLYSFLKSFSNKEYYSILSTTKTDSPYRITGGDRYANPDGSPMTNILKENKCFLPSANEIDTYDAGIHNGDYWLRSPLDNDNFPHGPCAAVMNDQNQHTYANVLSQRLIRPAMNLNCDFIILTSSIGSKSSLPSNEMNKVSESTAQDYKLTIKDYDRRDFKVVSGSVSGFAGDTVNFSYEGAKGGANEYISAIITERDNPNKVLYYGKLSQVLNVYDTVNMKIPTDLKGGNYIIKIFNEQCNGDKCVDFSSDLKQISLDVLYDNVRYEKDDSTEGESPQDLNVYKPGDEVTVHGQGNLSKKIGETYYTFAGWSDGTKTYKAGDKFIIDRSDVILTAQWQECKTIMMGAQFQYGSYIQMGNYSGEPMKWRVLNADGANIKYKQDGVTPEDMMLENVDGDKVSSCNAALLITDNLLKNANQAFGSNQKYNTSAIKGWLNTYFLPNAFDSSERQEILKTTKTDEPYTFKEAFTYANQDGTPMANILNSDEVFLLSAKEAASYFADTSRASSDWWWLRSPVSSSNNLSTSVTGIGRLYAGNTQIDYMGVRPAINFNRDSVVFTSALSNGKPSEVGETMSTVTAGTTNSYRLTLKDDKRDDFTVLEKDVNSAAGKTINLHYAAAMYGDGEYISAMITKNDGSNEVLYYGKLKRSIDINRGETSMVIPKELSAGTYTVKLFNEAIDEHSEVDYSSVVRDIALTVEN